MLRLEATTEEIVDDPRAPDALEALHERRRRYTPQHPRLSPAGSPCLGVAGATASAAPWRERDGRRFVYLVVVLFPRRGSLAASAAASLAATACYNYFFLPPVGTWTIADPRTGRARRLLLASILVSRLVASSAPRRGGEARREMEALYELSVDLFAARTGSGRSGRRGRALRSIDARGGALVLSGRLRPRRRRRDDGRPPVRSRRSAPRIRRPERRGRRGARGGRDARRLPSARARGRSSRILLVRARAPTGTPSPRSAGWSLAVERESSSRAGAPRGPARERALKTSAARRVARPGTPIRRSARPRVSAVRPPPRRTCTGFGRDGGSRRIDNLLAMARLDAGSCVPRPSPRRRGPLPRRPRGAPASSPGVPST